MDQYCSICSKKTSDVDIWHGGFEEVDDKTYCYECLNSLRDDLVFCEICYNFGHKDENFHDKYVEKNQDGKMVHYHIECLPEEELCNICHNYLHNEECVYFFQDNFQTIQCHKRCIEDKENIIKHDICQECGVSFKAKCEGCDHIFHDCYNPDCDSHNKIYPEDENRYDGYCSKCNW